MRKFLFIISVFAITLMAGCSEKTNTNKPVQKEKISAIELYAQLKEASKEGNLDKVRTLIKQGADVNMLIFDKTIGKDINDIEAQYEETPLMLASKNRHLDIVKELLASGAKVNQILPIHTDRGMMPGEDMTALEMACQSNNIEVLKILAEEGANTQSVLICACQIGSEELLKIALQNKPNLNFTTGEGGVSLLIMATENGYKNIVKALLEAGADPDYTDPFEPDYTALKAAKEKGNEEIVKLLQDAGAKEKTDTTQSIDLHKEIDEVKKKIDAELKEPTPVFLKDEYNAFRRPLDQKGVPIPWDIVRREQNKEEARKYEKLIKSKSLSSQELKTIFIEACRDKNQYTVKVSLDAGVKVSDTEWKKIIEDKVLYTDNPGEESEEDIDETFKLLLDANPKIDGEILGTLLNAASRSGFSQLIVTLVATGRIDKNDISRALLNTCPDGQDSTVKILLAAGADPNVKNENGTPALMLVEDIDAVKALIAAGADVNAKDNDGETALSRAQKIGLKEIVKLLKQAGAKE